MAGWGWEGISSRAGRRAGGWGSPFSRPLRCVKGLSREFLDFFDFGISGYSSRLVIRNFCHFWTFLFGCLACWLWFGGCDHFLGWRFFARRGGLARFFLFGCVFVLVRGQKRVVRRLVGVRECLGGDGWVGVNFVPSPRTPLLLLLLIGLTLADLG